MNLACVVLEDGRARADLDVHGLAVEFARGPWADPLAGSDVEEMRPFRAGSVSQRVFLTLETTGKALGSAELARRLHSGQGTVAAALCELVRRKLLVAIGLSRARRYRLRTDNDEDVAE